MVSDKSRVIRNSDYINYSILITHYCDRIINVNAYE